MAARPFISYAREDQSAAVRLYGDLRAAGVNPWLDLAELFPGHEWAAEIRRAMREASHIIVLLSAHSVGKTGFVQNETREALELAAAQPPDKIFVIPVRLDETVPKYEMLLKLQWLDLFRDYSSGLVRILAALGVSLPASGNAFTLSATEPDQIDSSSATIVNEASLEFFLATNRLSLHLDNQIAAFTLCRGVSELSPLALAAHVASLHVIGIETIEELERAIRAHRRGILLWAEEWLGGQDGPIPRGTYLTYLGYLLICGTGDMSNLKRFLEASHIHSADGDEKVAAHVMSAYRRLSGSNGLTAARD